MSLHDSGGSSYTYVDLSSSNGRGGPGSGMAALFIIGVALAVFCGGVLYQEANLPAWEVAALERADAWIANLGAGGTVLQCRHEEGSIFHCDGRIPGREGRDDRLVTFDCDGGDRNLCELCNQ